MSIDNSYVLHGYSNGEAGLKDCNARRLAGTGYRTPAASATGLEKAESCGKDAALGSPAEATGFRLSHNSNNNNFSSEEGFTRSTTV